ncbi:hypothetical protein NHQ30_011662 [Ciborinia camelliae]|nr:hypothetical protein NHQ30_011662 [Ciborinia camelliae]
MTDNQNPSPSTLRLNFPPFTFALTTPSTSTSLQQCLQDFNNEIHDVQEFLSRMASVFQRLEELEKAWDSASKSQRQDLNFVANKSREVAWGIDKERKNIRDHEGYQAFVDIYRKVWSKSDLLGRWSKLKADISDRGKKLFAGKKNLELNELEENDDLYREFEAFMGLGWDQNWKRIYLNPAVEGEEAGGLNA